MTSIIGSSEMKEQWGTKEIPNEHISSINRVFLKRRNVFPILFHSR